jgi:hypothetical protein
LRIHNTDNGHFMPDISSHAGLEILANDHSVIIQSFSYGIGSTVPMEAGGLNKIESSRKVELDRVSNIKSFLEGKLKIKF